MKKLLSALILSAAVALGAEVKTLTDMTGNAVKIPANVKQIAALWHANNQIILVLGGMDKIFLLGAIVIELLCHRRQRASRRLRGQNVVVVGDFDVDIVRILNELVQIGKSRSRTGESVVKSRLVQSLLRPQAVYIDWPHRH